MLTCSAFIAAKEATVFITHPNPYLYNTSSFVASSVCAFCQKPIHPKQLQPVFCCACCGVRIHPGCVGSELLMNVATRSGSTTVCSQCCRKDVASIQLMILKNAITVCSILHATSASFYLAPMFQSQLYQAISARVPAMKPAFLSDEFSSLVFYLKRGPSLLALDVTPIVGAISHVFYRRRDVLLRREIVEIGPISDT